MKSQKNIKEFVVDADKWICGGGGTNYGGLGEGATLMQNNHGYMCCLGHCMNQLGFSLIGRSESLGGHLRMGCYPSSIAKLCKNKGYESNPFVSNANGTPENTQFAYDAVDINDGDMSLKTRVEKLRKLFDEQGLKIRFKNIKKHL